MICCSVMDSATGEQLGLRASHAEAISGCHLYESGLELMTFSHDGSVHVWDVSCWADRIQCSLPSLATSKLPAARMANRPQQTDPLRDVKNIVLQIDGGNPVVAPTLSPLCSPVGNLLLDSLSLKTDGESRRQTSNARPDPGSTCISCVEAHRQKSNAARLSWAQRLEACGGRSRGFSTTALRHSIATHPSAETRREALQRQRDHKLWQSHFMTAFEQLQAEWDAVRLILSVHQAFACMICCCNSMLSRSHVFALFPGVAVCLIYCMTASWLHHRVCTILCSTQCARDVFKGIQ